MRLRRDLAAAADLGVVDRYQQHEIPQVAVRITQYDQHEVACGGCGRRHTATRPEGARPGPVAKTYSRTRHRASPRPSQFVIDPPMPLVDIARVHSAPVVSAESRNRCRDAAISASASDRPTHSAPSTLLPGSRSL